MSIIVKKLNESYGYISYDDVNELEKLYDALSFFVPNYFYMPSYVNGTFDGKIRLLNLSDKTFPLGLTKHVYDLCCSYRIQCSIDQDVLDSFDENTMESDIVSFFSEKKFFSKKKQIHPREDQIYASTRAVLKKRCLNICPTSFGKSLSITMECLWYIQKGMKCLIVVPTKDLVNQFYNDILDYATNEDGELENWYPCVQKIFYGMDKDISPDTNICISTWQSLHKLPRNYMNQFDVIILDECHKGQSKAIRNLMLSATNVKYRTGWTGSLSDEVMSELLITGLFGPKKEIITTKELMDKNIVASLNIHILRLKYPESISKEVLKYDYTDQMKFMNNYDRRSSLLLKIGAVQEKTGLMLYKNIKHGEHVFDMARKMFAERNIYLIHGNHFQMNDNKYKNLEELKAFIENDTNAIVLANYQVLSTGVSIKNLHWMMFFVPIKSFISTIQSIGRVLRISDTKKKAILIDIVDDFSTSKKSSSQKNFPVRNFTNRFHIYNMNSFNYSIKTVNL